MDRDIPPPNMALLYQLLGELYVMGRQQLNHQEKQFKEMLSAMQAQLEQKSKALETMEIELHELKKK